MPAIVLDQWIDLGVIGCRSITARAKRQGEAVSSDMPLNAAIYDSGRDVIFAVRGGYVYKLNAATGALILCSRYTFPTWDTAGIVLAPNVDKLYCSYWHEPTADGTDPIQGIFKINPDTLVLENFYDTNFDIDDDFGSGPCGMVYVNGFVYLIGRNQAGTNINAHKYNPLTDAIVSGINADGPTTTLESQIVVKASDSSLSVVRRQSVRNYAGAAFATNFTTANWAATGETGYGLAHDLVNDNYYVVCNTRNVLKIPATAAGAATVIDTGRADARPRRALWNSVDGKVYVPGGKDDTVIVIDPASADSITVKTGFDSPIDFVFTPTKKWAVQHSLVGLREVT